MSDFIVLTENDETQWDDKTGSQYHFPRMYQRLITPGTNAVHYNGRLRKKEYRDTRLSDQPHYFAVSTIGRITPDQGSERGDQYCEILDYRPFSKPVLAKDNKKYLEKIPENLRNNYWLNGVRRIDNEVYDLILSKSGLEDTERELGTSEDSQGLGSNQFFLKEGKKHHVLVSKYERNPAIRRKAIEYHGTSCQACGMNFKVTYGELGEGFIHVHHLHPISQSNGEYTPDIKKDFAVLCPNCHAMVHRKRDSLLSIEDLARIISENR